MPSGMESSHRRVPRGLLRVLQGFPRSTDTPWSPRRPEPSERACGPRRTGCASGSTVGPAAVPGRPEASVSTPAARAPSRRARRCRPADLPDSPGAATAAAGVPGVKAHQYAQARHQLPPTRRNCGTEPRRGAALPGGVLERAAPSSQTSRRRRTREVRLAAGVRADGRPRARRRAPAGLEGKRAAVRAASAGPAGARRPGALSGVPVPSRARRVLGT